MEVSPHQRPPENPAPSATAMVSKAEEGETVWRGIRLVRPCVLDLFCGGGGAGEGLRRAGFRTVVGVDHERRHKAAYEHAPGMHFRLADVAELLPSDLECFDFVWASPPCQAYVSLIPRAQREKHQARWEAQGRHLDHLPSVRSLLREAGRPYVIENVPTAPLLPPVVRLCGTMFGLQTFRHRHFESSVPSLSAPCPCNHSNKTTSGLVHAPPRPRVERYTSPCDVDSVPEDVEAVAVDYPCRREGRQDHVYRPKTDALRDAFRSAYGRTYARSLREVARAIGALVPMSEGERAEDRERYESARTSRVKPGHEEMFPIYGATSKHRGSTEEWQKAMGGCDWMDREQLTQAVPPAYSEHLGKQVLRTLMEEGCWSGDGATVKTNVHIPP